MKYLNDLRKLYYSSNFFLIQLRGFLIMVKLYRNWPWIIYYRMPWFPKTANIEYQLRKGVRVIVRLSDVDAQIVTNVFCGEYSYSGFGIHSTDTVIDIGANIGSFTLYAASRAINGQVFSFEPCHENFELLRSNVLRNDFSNVSLHKTAVFNKVGKMRLFLNDKSLGMANFFDPQKDFEKVKTTTLDKIFRQYKLKRCNFLKLDCEGSEYEILTSTPRAVLNKIEKIVFEYHPRVSQTGKLSEILSILKRNRFKIVRIKNNGANGIIFAKNPVNSTGQTV